MGEWHLRHRLISLIVAATRYGTVRRAVLLIVTMALPRTTPETSLAADVTGREHAALSGTFAASMERLVGLIARSVTAPAALIALLGDDRRSFYAGQMRRDWFSHDAGVLIRCGLMQRTLDNGGTLSLNDLGVIDDVMLRSAAVELNIASIASATFSKTDGSMGGMICVVDDVPRAWNPDDVATLAEFGSLAGTELQLRQLLSDREVREQRLRHESVHDPLTGLPNRALFMRRLADATLRARRGHDGLFAVLFLDIDSFKLVNDSMGHHVGDEMLVNIARRLEGCVRGGDIVARLGGDEFAILLERIIDVRDAAMVAERVQEALHVPFAVGGYSHASSASIGVALSTGATEQPEYVLRSADLAMYRAKNSGRGRYEMFDRAMHAEALTRLQIETDLRYAFDRNEFFLHYQPIISLKTGQIVGAEALVRWHHSDRGIVSPATFVPVAEDTGLIVPLGRWVLREACRQAREWRSAAGDRQSFSISVNLSVREFAQPDLVKTVASILEETGLPAQALRIEITESAIIGQKHPAIETVEQLRALGVAIHLDDFGTGYSALSYLHRLPLDAVKVDRAFIASIDHEERPLHVVRAIISLAHAIGLEVVAEGVANERQLELLREMGCDLAQGFIFSRPCHTHELETLLTSGTTW
jgi:diguanylate cyclase (GGDEF)-like protein